MARKLTAAAAALATLAACAPEVQAPVKVRALVLSSNGEYVPQQVELKTVEDIVTLEGPVARLIGGANIRLDSQDLEVQNALAANSDEALERALLKDVGRPVMASYITADDGVLWPADFHTWNLVTTYYNLERAWEYFRDGAGVAAKDLPQTTAYYFPEFVITSEGEEPQRDNAIFFSPTKSFMVLPFKEIQSAPLSINATILTHEYAHLVFNQKVYGGRGLPEPIARWSLGAGLYTPGLNLLKSLDEGLADFHAYAASCQTAFGCNTRILATSYSDEKVEIRDLSKNRCMTASLYKQLLYSSYDQFSGQEYAVGTLLASALYKASAGLTAGQRQQLQRALVMAYSDEDPAKPGIAQLARMNLDDQSGFTLPLVAGSIVQHISDTDLKQAVCDRFATHLQIPVDELKANGCPPSTTTGSDCPSINTTP